ncbi:GNAT family N-acetyltransferase [candidate division KSB3 bacterium]|uniref:GNAT family N-acetyltransferase n=1 Tax=candidate division KSB3 bacterium TaxID=2044937 RepID=A0A2G6EA00_9BACT|nr:MAG: GNAT family N-acetyltransferase [candidate division KSB3 bacterium]PIE29539.1 MAG: GNAT family N-acetyltransferase [candidate division KSB3 bacterium]
MDMLVKLYELPAAPPLDIGGIRIRRIMGPDKQALLEWLRGHFSSVWAAECEIAFSRQPVSCFIASNAGKIRGFSVYDVTAKGIFGPMGVAEEYRSRGIGKSLLLTALHDMRHQGYAYAVIGWAGPTRFYEKYVGAKVIEASQAERGMYSDLLRHDPKVSAKG